MTQPTSTDIPRQLSCGACDGCGEVRDSLVYFHGADVYICQEVCLKPDQTFDPNSGLPVTAQKPQITFVSDDVLMDQSRKDKA